MAGTAGRYGTRYGRKLRKRVNAVEEKQRGRNKCPFCSKHAVKRLAKGIYNCEKCNTKFSGKAYYFGE
ncbi:50S ribosomal protein L37ae [Candidatus Woesearchaeota archaeon]|nr:50S ribosomal protein L37ae [Candidatus Woesearchaeota archaeon]MBW3014140.1 50S ribosomal protein L37ae [Candidatus Woesearchaeota archaeon]